MTKLNFDMPVFDIAPSYMVGPSSREVDSWRPAPVLKILPADKTAEATVELSIDAAPTISETQMPPAKKAAALFRRQPAPINLPENRLYLDFRRNEPSNWSHALNNHLPYLFLACEKLALGAKERPGLVLPEALTSYCRTLFEALGIDLVFTDAPVSGRFIKLEVAPWHAIRGPNVGIVRRETSKWPLFEAVKAIDSDQGERLFLSRRGGRSLENESEIEALLTPRGFRKVYMEDYAPLEQIAVVARATDIVAVHGAAMGLLIYNAAFSETPPRVLEIFGPGYVVNPFRNVTQQLGGAWIGVHGRITADMLDYLNDGDGHPRRFTMANTKVDPQSLALAMEMLFDGVSPPTVSL